jgi:hypothetical protein
MQAVPKKARARLALGDAEGNGTYFKHRNQSMV